MQVMGSVLQPATVRRWAYRRGQAGLRLAGQRGGGGTRCGNDAGADGMEMMSARELPRRRRSGWYGTYLAATAAEVPRFRGALAEPLAPASVDGYVFGRLWFVSTSPDARRASRWCHGAGYRYAGRMLGEWL